MIFTGCSEDKIAKNKIPLVKVQKVDTFENNPAENYSGVVKGRYETNLAFQVGGQIMSRNVEVGSQVKAGDVLMTINPRDVVQQTNQAESQVASAKAQLDLAATNLNRYRQLFQENAIAASVLDQYQTNYDAAVAAYDNAIAVAAQSQNALDYTNLVAEVDGVISAINVESGQIVAAGQTVATIVQTDELEIAVDIPESKISSIETNQPAIITFWALPDNVEGFVREISPIADAAARTFAVKISVPNPPLKMQLGITANVIINSKDNLNDKAIILPLTAIYQTDETPKVWLVVDNKVVLKAVDVTNFEDNKIIVRGLNNNDLVVTAGVHKLHEGQEVRISN